MRTDRRAHLYRAWNPDGDEPRVLELFAYDIRYLCSMLRKHVWSSYAHDVDALTGMRPMPEDMSLWNARFDFNNVR